MKLRWLLLVTLAAFMAAVVWGYQLYSGQLNNSLALQLCVMKIEKKQRATGSLPSSVDCTDHWGHPVEYVVRDGTYVLVSAGSDGVAEDANYGSMKPSEIASADICLTSGADTVFVGQQPVRRCLK